MSAPPTMPSGWFPDPHGRHEHRWFNGTAWTADVADAGQRFVDPLGAAPGQVSQKSGNGPATAAITCGLIAWLFAWMPVLVVLGFVLAVVALLTGRAGLRRSRQTGVGRGSAIAGLVTGGSALALCAVGAVFTVSFVRVFDRFVSPGPHRGEITSCTLESSELTVTGMVENRDDVPHDYTVYTVVGAPDDVDDLVTELDDVAPGETREFEAARSVAATGTCEARLVVHGPLPYGIDMERVNDV